MKNLQKILIAIILLLPLFTVFIANFGEAHHMAMLHLPPTGDQAPIYQNFKEAFEGKIPGGIQNGWMPVGYLALIGFYHKASILWTSPTIYSSFVYNGLVYAALTALISVLIMFRVATDQSPTTNRLLLAVSCTAFWFALFMLSAIFRFCWIPWSHYASAFVGITTIACFYESLTRRKSFWFFAATFFGFLFLQTRRHEAIVIFLASGFTGIIFIISQLSTLKLRISFKAIFMRLTAIGIGLALSWLFIHYFSNGMPLSSHYAKLRSMDSFINEYMKIYPETIPVRIIQTFLDPNFYSYGNIYSIRVIMKHHFTSQQFAMPMIFQLPILWFLLPLALFSLYAVVKTKPWKKQLAPAMLIFFCGFFSFSILSLAYLGTAIWSGVHLKNGLVREFILSVLLLAVATGPALWILLAEQFKNKNLTWIIPTGGITVLGIIWGQLILPYHSNLFTFPSKHISALNSKSFYHCEKENCEVKMNYVYDNGRVAQPPFDYVILNFSCPVLVNGKSIGAAEAGITKRGQAFAFEVMKCNQPVTVEVYPLFEGYCGSGESPSLTFKV